MSSKACVSGFLDSVLHTTCQTQERKHVIGLLGITDFHEDLWMTTDYVFLQELIGARDDKSLWLSGAPLPDEDYILGDPACDRIAFRPPAFVTCEDSPNKLLARFLLKVKDKADQLAAKETLVLVLCGHGTHNTLTLGDSYTEGASFSKLDKFQLEMCLERTKGTIWLINTACYSGSWESPCWSLLAGANSGEESMSIATSGSGKSRGGFFTAGLIAGYAKDYDMDAPCPGSVDDQGIRGPQHPHDFGSASNKIPIPPTHNSTLRQIEQRIHERRDYIGRVYTTAGICFKPSPMSQMDVPHKLPFRPLSSQFATLHRFRCVPPSPATDSHSTTAGALWTAVMSIQSGEPTLTFEEEVTLVHLARQYLETDPLMTSTHTQCLDLVHHAQDRPLTSTAKSWLLSELKERRQRNNLAITIAAELGWTTNVVSVARLKDRDYNHPSHLQNEAEAAGCVLTALHGRGHSYKKYVGAACWLAHIWDAEGRPDVDSNVWQSAVARATAHVRNSQG